MVTVIFHFARYFTGADTKIKENNRRVGINELFHLHIVLDSKEVIVVSLKVVSSSLAICFNFSIRYMLI